MDNQLQPQIQRLLSVLLAGNANGGSTNSFGNNANFWSSSSNNSNNAWNRNLNYNNSDVNRNNNNRNNLFSVRCKKYRALQQLIYSAVSGMI